VPMSVEALAAGSAGGLIGPITTAPEKIARANVSPPKDFDLDSFMSSYSGHARQARLQFVAHSSKELEADCYRRLLEDLKKTSNTSLYKDISERVGLQLGSAYAFDKVWVEATDKRSASTVERLDNELAGFKNNLVKESIRIAHNEIGDFQYERGELNTALKCYMRARDYCTTSKHMLQLCMNVIKVSLEMNNFTHVLNYVNKAESTTDLDKLTEARLKVVHALALLDSKKYKPAARKFLEVVPELGMQFHDLLAAHDIATFTGLCALASFDRQELKKKLLDNIPFKNFLDLAPDVRDLIADFHASRYSSCLQLLTKMKPYLELDLYFWSHVAPVYELIRNKALVQYFSPYVSVNLNTMADAFRTTVPALEKELSRLINDSKISARIDSHNKVLYARTSDQRSATYDRAMQMGDEYQRNTRALLLRVNCMRNEFFVRPVREDTDREKKG